MKTVLKLAAFVLVAISFATNADLDDLSNQVVSPSGKFILLVDESTPTNGGLNDTHVWLALLNRSRSRLDLFDSLASPYQKWAAGWMDGVDVVVLYSADIGTSAFEVVDVNFSPIEVSREIEQRGRELYHEKYGSWP